MTTEKLICQWVEDNYGESEAKDPSWDIKSLAEHISSHTSELVDALPYQQQLDLFMGWDLADEWTGLSQEQREQVYDRWMDSDCGFAVSDALVQLVDEKNRANKIAVNAELLAAQDTRQARPELPSTKKQRKDYER